MPDRTFIGWPFFEDRHRDLIADLDSRLAGDLGEIDESGDLDDTCRALVRRMGAAGWLDTVVPRPVEGPAPRRLDLRSACLVREAMAYHSPLADFAFALQGLGSGALTFYGTDEQRARWLPRVAAGEAIAAFALSEAEAGSDVSAMRSTARRDGEDWLLDGEKTWISNAGIADHYVVFCRTPELGEKRFGAFMVEAGTDGLSVPERIETVSPHPLGTIRLDGCRVGAANVIGEPGAGMRVALGTLDVFRATVGAGALGFARRALDEALAWCKERHVFGTALSDLQLTQAKLAEMAVSIDAAALLVYRAAWIHDQGQPRLTREAAMAKLFATESAQRVIDDAVQLLGARGVQRGNPVESLYRAIRALRIYEGTTEVQKLIIAGQL